MVYSKLSLQEFPKLIVCEDNKEHSFQLDKELITIGRSEENDISVGDISSSRRHCQIRYHNGQWELIDLDSRNGTLVNGVLVVQKRLSRGDVIEIGRTRLYFRERKQETELPTLRLDTSYFLDPLADMEPSEQVAVFKRERSIFLRILEVVRLINSKRDLNDVLRTILELVIDVTHCEHGLVLLANEKTGSFSLRAFKKIDAERASREAEVVARTLAGILVESGAFLVCSDFATDDRFLSFGDLAELGLKSFVCYPFIFEGETIGLLYLDNHANDDLITSDQVKLGEILAAQAAIAIRNARLFERNRRRRRELEDAKTKMEHLSAQLREQVMSRVENLDEAVRMASGGEKPKFRHQYSEIITASQKMYQALEVVDKVVSSSVPVLIEGESGTGKELIARALHFNGKRSPQKFISENCAAVPANLMESEFFGHERGAFTGANRQKKGLFELASHGTLFLDEIGDMPLELQSKFLRVLQNGEIRRVGGNELIRVDVRIVSATNQNLKELIRQGRFREDLYYRLNVIMVRLPPLRDRKEDIPLLLDHFLKDIARKEDRGPKILEAETLQLLQNYEWPGNVRELQNEIERLAALSGGRIPADIVGDNIKRSVGKKLKKQSRPLRDIVRLAVEEIEEDVIRTTLNEAGWKKTQAASVLGISRPTLDNKIGKYGIRRRH